MELQTIVLNSEYVFRNYVISNLRNIYEIIIFEDSLDNVIFFYILTKDGFIIAAKDKDIKKFYFFKKLYIQITINNYISIITRNNKEIFIKLN